MKKDFNSWNEQKKWLDIASDRKFFKEWEIWRTAIGANIGSESCGKGETFRRPVLVLKKLSATSCIAIPLSTQEKIWSRYAEYDLHWDKYWALLYQVRMMSTNRFQRRLWALDDKDFLNIKEKLKLLLQL